MKYLIAICSIFMNRNNFVHDTNNSVYDIETIKNTILYGDNIENLKKIPSESIDLIFADPPYNMQTEGNLLRTDGSIFKGVNDTWDKFNTFEEYDNYCILWLSECQRILKKDGSIWVIGSFQNIYRIGKIMQDLGYWILNDVIWSKPNAVPNFAGTRFQNSHETLLWCGKNKNSKYHFNYQTMKKLNGGTQMKSVWNIGICIGNERLKDETGKKVHSTQKPEKLLYNIIIASSKENDIILDPFFGTGTTGAIAKQTGRNWIGLEREETYIKHAKERISKVKTILDEFTKADFDIKPPKFSIKQLLDLNLIKESQVLYDKKKEKTVTVQKNGNVYDGIDSLSIHKMSAKLKKCSNNNGWDYFFIYDKDNNFVSINELRFKAKKLTENEGKNEKQ